jgi:hypothetical protein
MEENKVILSEINRMRQIMGLKLIMEATVPPAVRQALLDFMGFTEKQVDALERSAGDFSDLSKISDEFATLGIKNLDDLQTHVAKEMGIKSLNDVSDDVILKYMKQTPEIMQGVTKKLNTLVADAADAIIKKADWESLVGKDAADEIELALRDTIDAESAANVKILVDNYKSIIDNEIADAVANGRTVPDSLRNLSEELGEKSKQADNINIKQNKDFSQVPGDKNLAKQDAENAAKEEADKAAKAAKEAEEVAQLEKENEELLKNLEEIAKRDAMVASCLKQLKTIPSFSRLKLKQRNLILEQVQTWADEGRSESWIIQKGRKEINQAFKDLKDDLDFQRKNPAMWKKTLKDAAEWISDHKGTVALSIGGVGLLLGWWTWAELAGKAVSTAGDEKDYEKGLGKEGTYTNDVDGLQKWAVKNGYNGPLNSPVPADFSLKLVQDGAGTDHQVKYNEDKETFELLN